MKDLNKLVSENLNESYKGSSRPADVVDMFLPGVDYNGTPGVIIGGAFKGNDSEYRRVENFVKKCGLAIGYTLQDGFSDDAIGKNEMCVMFVPYDGQNDVAYCYALGSHGVELIDSID